MSANDKQVGGRHYKTAYEHWDLVIAVSMGYLEGNATKYVSRWRKKDGLEDLKKAKHYLDKLQEAHTSGYKPPTRYYSLDSIVQGVNLFAEANALNENERDFVKILSTYAGPLDLMEAFFILEEIMHMAAAELEKYTNKKEELNCPGTPEDGGHHEKQGGGTGTGTPC
jgi:hypothetical protein